MKRYSTYGYEEEKEGTFCRYSDVESLLLSAEKRLEQFISEDHTEYHSQENYRHCKDCAKDMRLVYRLRDAREAK